MISDTLFDAIEEIKRYQKELPWVYADAEITQDIENCKSVMDALRAKLDTPPEEGALTREWIPMSSECTGKPKEFYSVSVGETASDDFELFKKCEYFYDFKKAYEWAVSELGAGRVLLWRWAGKNGFEVVHAFNEDHPISLEKLALAFEIDLVAAV